MGRRSFALVGPNLRDPRLHVALVTITLFVIGIGWLEFGLSIPQIVITMLVCAVIEVVVVLWRTSTIAWPASALQTASSTCLILRARGTTNDERWTTEAVRLFVAVAVFGLLTKYLIRYRGRHIFNPSNIALVAAFLFLKDRARPLYLWWAPFGPAMALAYAVILVGGFLICRRLGLFEMGVTFWIVLAFGVSVLAVLDHTILARWSPTPISGWHYWWILLTSPEVLIFLFFMITDPRTVPAGRVARIAFGATIALVASVLVAPWGGEYWTKVAILGSLAIVCVFRPVFDRFFPLAGSPDDDPRRFVTRMFALDREHVSRRQVAARIAVVVIAAGLFVGAVAAANTFSHNDSPVEDARVTD